MISTTVSFTKLADNTYGTYTPGVPPVLWTVPYDVFYPFDVSAGHGARSLSTAMMAIPLMAAIMLRA
jgi:hypothetical protein